jgi:alpha-N-acetylglucosamine transferase
MSRGALYIATGEDFIREAEIAVKSLHEEMPELRKAIVTDGSVSPTGFDQVIKLDDPSYGFRDKIAGLRQTPYDQTVFLDTDTYVYDDFSELFDILSKFDIAATHNQNRDLHTYNPEVPKCFPEYSTGVLAYNKFIAEPLIDEWDNVYDGDELGDQPSFRKVLYKSDIRVATLPREYNCAIKSPGHVVKPVKIFHGRLIDINTPGAEMYYPMENAIGRINTDDGHRLFTRGGYVLGLNPPLRERLRHSLRERGLAETVRAGLTKLF